jgi:peptide/nickel transport system ATP-binding protein
MNDLLLCVEDLSVAYPAQIQRGQSSPWVIENLSLTLNRGERIGLVGESGCGKSTLGRTIMQLLPPGSKTQGQIRVAQQDVLSLSAEALRRFRGEEVALIFQDPMTRLDPLMTIRGHCLETLKAHQPKLSRTEAKARVLETLQLVNIPVERWNQYPHEFSGGMRQRVAIALALLLDPKLIIADEPTTSLDVTVSAKILQELTSLCNKRKMGLLLISHDLALVSEYCDRVAVMYQGQMVELGPAQEILHRPQHSYTQRLVESALHLQRGTAKAMLPAPKEAAAAPILELKGLEQYYIQETNPIARLFGGADQTIRPVDHIDLQLIEGETLGLVGESGCGKSTLSRTILQLIRPKGGSVHFGDIDLTQLSGEGLRRARRQIQMIFQDPRACLNPMMSVGNSVAEPLLIQRLQSPANAILEAKKLFERVDLTPAENFMDRLPSDLSGGQLQRVAIARALITEPKLLICDEPVSMLDASIQSQVLELMQSLKEERGLTYIFITHDLWVARFFCDRIAVMNRGKIVELGPTEQIFQTPQHPYTRTLLGAAPLLARLSGTDINLSDPSQSGISQEDTSPIAENS